MSATFKSAKTVSATFFIDYFGPTGFLYKRATAVWKVGRGHEMNDACAILRGLHRSGGQEGMPGGLDERWKGYAVVVMQASGGDCSRLVKLGDFK
jgi:hypothetical protein